jgi:hypothetical protein
MNNTSQLLVDITRREFQETMINKTDEENLILPKVKNRFDKKTNFSFKESCIE